MKKGRGYPSSNRPAADLAPPPAGPAPGAKETEDLKEVIRQAHEVLGDLRRTMKETRELIESYTAEKVEPELDSRVAAAVEEYGRGITRAIESAQNAVYDRFDTITNIMLGKGKATDFEALALRTAQRREAIKQGKETT